MIDYNRIAAEYARHRQTQSLDFPDAAFDLVMSTDVIHHVHRTGGCPAYLGEAFRVLRRDRKVCTVTKELQRYPSMETLKGMTVEAGFKDIREDLEEFNYELTDIQAYRDKAFSSLHIIPDDAWGRGLARMEEDLKAGPIMCTAYYTVLWGTKPGR